METHSRTGCERREYQPIYPATEKRERAKEQSKGDDKVACHVTVPNLP